MLFILYLHFVLFLSKLVRPVRSAHAKKRVEGRVEQEERNQSTPERNMAAIEDASATLCWEQEHRFTAIEYILLFFCSSGFLTPGDIINFMWWRCYRWKLKLIPILGWWSWISMEFCHTILIPLYHTIFCIYLSLVLLFTCYFCVKQLIVANLWWAYPKDAEAPEGGLIIWQSYFICMNLQFFKVCQCDQSIPKASMFEWCLHDGAIQGSSIKRTKPSCFLQLLGLHISSHAFVAYAYPLIQGNG